MDVKNISLELKNALHVIFVSTNIEKPSRSSRILVDNQTFIWQRTVLGSVLPPVQEDENQPGFSFTLQAKPEYDWLIKDYQFELVIVHQSRNNLWKASVTAKSRPAPLPNAPIIADFFPARLSSTLSFGPVTFAGIAASFFGRQNPLISVTCAGNSVLETVQSTFWWPSSTAPSPGDNGCPGTTLIREALRDSKIPAVCTVQVQPISKCSCLAMEASRATGKLFALPINPAEVCSLDVIQVTSRERASLAYDDSMETTPIAPPTSDNQRWA